MRSCFDKTLVWIAIYQLCVCTLFFILSHNSKLVHELHYSSLQSDKNLGSRECHHLVMGHSITILKWKWKWKWNPHDGELLKKCYREGLSHKVGSRALCSSSSLQSDKNLGSRECGHLVMGHYTLRAILINIVIIIMRWKLKWKRNPPDGELLKKCFKSTNHVVLRKFKNNLILLLFFGTKTFRKHNLPLEVNKGWHR